MREHGEEGGLVAEGPSISPDVNILAIENRPLDKVFANVPGSKDILPSSMRGKGLSIVMSSLLKKNFCPKSSGNRMKPPSKAAKQDIILDPSLLHSQSTQVFGLSDD